MLKEPGPHDASGLFGQHAALLSSLAALARCLTIARRRTGAASLFVLVAECRRGRSYTARDKKET